MCYTAKVAALRLRSVRYADGDLPLTGYLADGSGDKRAPGVLIAHEAPGMSDHVRDRALALAGLGYVAFALDLYGTEGLPLEAARAKHLELMTTPGLMARRSLAALDVLSEQPNVDASRLAAIGFCQGGIVALELARHRAPICCAIGFHPGLKRPAESPDGPISAKILMMVGDDDPVVPAEDRVAFAANMKMLGADWQLHIFGGVGHSFTNKAIDALAITGFGYDSIADRRAWKLMLTLLEEQIGRPQLQDAGSRT